MNTLAPYILTALIDRPGRLVYLSSGLHRGGEGSLDDLDWTKRTWDPAKAYAESKLQVVALAFALARRWPRVLCNAVDLGWVRTRMGGPAAPVDLETRQRTQTWLAVIDEPAAMVSGRYWHHLRQEQPRARQPIQNSRTNSAPDWARSRVLHFLGLRSRRSAPDSYGLIDDWAFTFCDYITARWTWSTTPSMRQLRR
ncbi:hypothetical protein QCM80_02295 [Bradyrhizobium sp. SSUT112]|uniref:hypothetical protein n=1 Tax=Bradyrhizobium sp. SSUT112 TaxID=3040604 RepID=UPI0024486F9F|nr:hypothetical protein [Bradyrhizobium sp. SSUT112]MDH2349519.1 hypothetical protein [Bradyrhizobium sp. SSUT112]